MSQQFEKLTTLLKELFQLNRPDLDFGFYRIMHAKSEEITQFLERDLLPQVQEALSQYKSADKAELEQELAEMEEQARKLEADPDTLPKVVALRRRIAEEAVDLNALEAEVYDHLYSFFRRYYSEGDFLGKRVYKPGVYAIPYEGEEVKLHWANADQYYIKTDEYLRNYTFRLRPDDQDDPMRVHFRLVDAAEGEHDNVKADKNKKRVFLLADGDFIAEVPGETGPELTIHFEYRLATVADWPEAERAGKSKPPAQKDLISLAEKRIRDVSNDNADIAQWIKELKAFHITSNGEVADYSRLRAHLNRYTARNTFDYFIHKDLGSFLRRELDFFIKNEVMHLDNVENETAPRVEQFLSKIKVIRRIAGKIIEFLAQLEDFQKKLWLKKKFVVETSWCIRVGFIPEEFYGEIAANEAQREEWVRLCEIDEVEGDLATPAYSVPLSEEFLKAHPTLVVDTRHFDREFVDRLLDHFGDVDETTDGVLFHSENFQTLSLIDAQYRNQVKTIYIDPPYNRLGDGFPYKDNYRHSSWLTMMLDRVKNARTLLHQEGVLFSNIDENERDSLQVVLDETFGRNNRIEEVIWAQNTTHSQSPLYSTNHEYIQVYAYDRAAVEHTPAMFREPKPGFRELMEVVKELNINYAPIAEVVEAVKKLFKNHIEDYSRNLQEQGLEYDNEAKRQDPWRGIYNYCNAEYRDINGSLVTEDEARAKDARLVVWRESDPSAPAQKQSDSTRDLNDPNYRFYCPSHPVTKKPCQIPRRGWAWPQSWTDDSRDSFESLDDKGRIVWGKDESKVPQYKRFLHEVETNVAKSFFQDYTDGEKQLAALFGVTGIFPTPKPTTLATRFISQTAGRRSIILDFFAGSGTTGHAVIDLNREDGGRRKFILVEMGNYFDTVLLPRLKKVIYSPDWRDGKTKHCARREEIKRAPRVLKVVRLESYEDTLNNLTSKRTSAQQDALDLPEANGSDSFKEQYLLRYILDVETRGSQSLLNIDDFLDPTSYQLKVKRPSSDESREVNVDLLETFNWLLGLKVQRIFAPQTCDAHFRRDDEGRLQLEGCLKESADGPWWFRAVSGVLPDERRVLILWRKRPGGETPEGMEEDNLVLEEWFKARGFTEGASYDLIYINGICQLETLKAPSDAWEVRLTEDAFRRLMFGSEEV